MGFFWNRRCFHQLFYFFWVWMLKSFRFRLMWTPELLPIFAYCWIHHSRYSEILVWIFYWNEHSHFFFSQSMYIKFNFGHVSLYGILTGVPKYMMLKVIHFLLNSAYQRGIFIEVNCGNSLVHNIYTWYSVNIPVCRRTG